MNLQEVRKLIDLVMKSGVAELEISEGEKNIRISNVKTPAAVANYFTPDNSAFTSPLLAQQSTVASTGQGGAQVGEKEKLDAKPAVNAPMIGTVYLSATPGAKHFVEVGQQVKVGDTLCLIEAMKMFNRIEADKPGKITSILVDNAQPVEYGQPLFIIE